MSAAPGRACPLHYRYAPEALAAATALQCETLYVVGGLYGNERALETILAMAADEAATVVFNGDHNWFDVAPVRFRRINEAVLTHTALRGNVETELADDGDAGCGCGYPDWVGDAEVERSNAIMARLRATGAACPDITGRLAALPMYAAAVVGAERVAIVHGDTASLAGWDYAQERLREDDHRRGIAAHFDRAGAGIIACSHTCLPVAAAFATAQGAALLFNNGAAGMPNFRGALHGVVTRIAPTPARAPLYEAKRGRTYVSALPVRYDHAAWLKDFLEDWPPGTPAYASYHERILAGPRYTAADATRWLAPQTAVH